MPLFASSVLGLEVSASTLRAVELSLGRRPKLKTFASLEIPQTEQQHTAKLDVLTIAPHLKELLANKGGRRFGSKELYVSISEELVFRKILELPAHVTEDELGLVVRTEVASFLPEDISTMELDYQVMPRGADNPEGPGLHVSVVAVSKQIVSDYLALARNVKLKLRAVDTRPAALARATVPATEKNEVLIIELSERGGLVAVVQQGLVWATGLAKFGADVEAGTSAVIDELDHVVKFYANRTGTVSSIKTVYLIAPEALRADFHKALSAQLQDAYTLVVPDTLGIIDDVLYAGALGSALYPVYEQMKA